MKRLELEPTANYVSTTLPARTKVEVVVSYEIGNISTDSLRLGRTFLKTDTPVWVVGLPNQARTSPMVFELDSPECRELRRQGLYEQTNRVKGVMDREFMREHPSLFSKARKLTRRRAFGQPMTLDAVANLRLEVLLS
jgi:hypothetical protein